MVGVLKQKLQNKEKNTRISIVVPVYNVEQYIEECLDSILNQTYQDFELILVDDGSKDQSGAICDRYQKEHSNIKVIHQENQGQAATRNHGVEISQGEWVMFVDSDDVIHPCLLEYLYKAAIESNAGMAVSKRTQGKCIPNDFFTNYSYTAVCENVTVEKLEEYYDNNAFYYWAPFPSLMKKEIVQSIPFPEGRIYEDNAVACQLLYAAKKLAIVPIVMYYYRVNPNGTMNQPMTIKKLDYLWALERQIEFYERIQSVPMCRKISSELLESTFYDYEKAHRENNEDLCVTIKKKLKRILRTYKQYISYDKRISRKTDKILAPKIYRIKKILKVY